jgi:hypothetical protein
MSSVSSLASRAGERPASRASAARLRALARPAIAVRSMTAGAGKMSLTAQGGDHPGNDRLAVIRAPGGLCRRLDYEGQIGVARRPQAKRPGKEERMVRHNLQPAGVIGEGGGGDVQLRRQANLRATACWTFGKPASAVAWICAGRGGGRIS